jgi:hypothetical protein
LSGYVVCFAPCLVCKQVFGFNPNAVPSLTVDGERQPICLQCMTAGNARRVAMGLEPHPIRPDAYEPISENEL